MANIHMKKRMGAGFRENTGPVVRAQKTVRMSVTLTCSYMVVMTCPYVRESIQPCSTKGPAPMWIRVMCSIKRLLITAIPPRREATRDSSPSRHSSGTPDGDT